MSDLPPLFAELYTCEGCGLAYDAVTIEGAVRLVDAVVGELPGLLAGLDDLTLRRRWQRDEWSPIEYACHVRDVLAAFTLRLHRGVVEDRPTIDPMYAVLRAERFDYAEASVEAVVEELRALSRGFAAEVAVVPAEAWGREIVRVNGGVEEVRTLRWVVRQAAHEAVHHRDDIVRISRS